uniref:Uncharacterized protein LOC104244133 n=1 Tax=Nicotiana sylvestris TaxID=4096 RepID=A0A1U7Y3Q2_NICSY|nr:PREDICTED: uncharacterized protein LOC104244133 [Nicotiana sylvestris]
MDEEDAGKTAFTIPWRTDCYRVMPFGLKNTGVAYMRAMIAIFHDMMHQQSEVYEDDVIIKSKTHSSLGGNPVDDEYQPLSTYFPDKEVNSVEVIPEDTNSWKIFFDGAVNAKGVGIGTILISPTGQHYPAIARLRFFYTNYTVEYGACIMGMNMAMDLDVEELQHVEDLSKRFKSVEFRYIPRFHNELADALATLASMLLYPGNVHIDLLEIQIRERHGFFTFKVITKKVVVEFVYSNIICRFGIPNTIITNNAENVNSHLMREPKTNGVVEGANKNIKKILRKMIQSYRQWNEKLPFALLGYRTTVRTSVRAMPYLLVYGTEAVVPAKVEIPSLPIIVEAEIEDDEWVKTRLEQLTMIDEKRMATICQGQLYQQRMIRAYIKKVLPRKFEVGKLVLRRILPHHEEEKGKFSPNRKSPYIIKRVLPRGALYLGDIERNDTEAAVNANAVKKYNV